MMKKTFLTILGTLLISSPAYAEDLRLVTEKFAFHNYEDADGNITGSSTEVIKKALEKSGVTATFELFPWARAYNMALKEANTCVYSTTVTEQRKPLFKWVTPVTHSGWNFYAATDRAGEFKISSKEDVKAAGWSVGVYNQDVRHQTLEKEGGYKLDVSNDDKSNAKKLVGGRIDLWFVSPESVAAQKKNDPDFDATVVFEERKTDLGLACNPDVDEAVIAKLQTALDELIASGERDKIIEAEKAKYLSK